MHSTFFTVESVKYVVIHNGDWSGDAIIRKVPDDPTQYPVGVEVPGVLLKAIGYHLVGEEVLGTMTEAVDRMKADLAKEAPTAPFISCKVQYLVGVWCAERVPVADVLIQSTGDLFVRYCVPPLLYERVDRVDPIRTSMAIKALVNRLHLVTADQINTDPLHVRVTQFGERQANNVRITPPVVIWQERQGEDLTAGFERHQLPEHLKR